MISKSFEEKIKFMKKIGFMVDENQIIQLISEDYLNQIKDREEQLLRLDDLIQIKRNELLFYEEQTEKIRNIIEGRNE